MTRSRASTVAAGAVLVIVTAWLVVRAGDGMRFAVDEWMYISTRHDLSSSSILEPHNGHLTALPAMAYLLGFHTVGLSHPGFYRGIVVVLHLAATAVLATRVLRRHGPLPAAAAWIVVGLTGVGAMNYIWAFQMSLVGSVLWFLVALLLLDLDRERPRVALLVSASACVALSLACSGVGLAAAAAVIVVTVAGASRRRTWWVPVVPLALFALWFALWHESQPVTLDPEAATRWLTTLVGTTLGSFVGLDGPTGLLPAGLLAVAVLGAIAVAWRRGAVHAHQLAGPVFVLAFAGSTALARSEKVALFGVPGRYLYVTVIGVVVSASDLLPRLVTVGRARRLAIGSALVAVAALAVWAGQPERRQDRDYIMAAGTRAAANLAVIEAFPDRFSDDEPADRFLERPMPLIGDYRRAAEALGSSAALDPSEFPSVPAALLKSAEMKLLAADLVTVEPSDARGCTPAARGTTRLRLDAGDSVVIRVDDPTVLRVRRFVPWEAGRAMDVNPGEWRISVPTDDFGLPWRLDFASTVTKLRCPSS